MLAAGGGCVGLMDGLWVLGLLGLCRWVWCWFGVLLIELVCLLSSGVGGFCWFALSCGVVLVIGVLLVFVVVLLLLDWCWLRWVALFG